MAVSPDYLVYVIDQLTPFARVVSRRMFGGAGLYADELFFGLVDDDTLYFKVDDSNRGDYLERGSDAFRPYPDQPHRSMNYYRVPAEVLDEPDVLAVWARKALRVAATAAAAKSRARPAAKTPARAHRAPSSPRTSHKKRR